MLTAVGDKNHRFPGFLQMAIRTKKSTGDVGKRVGVEAAEWAVENQDLKFRIYRSSKGLVI